MKTNRRAFLRQSALGVSSALLGARFVSTAENAPKYFDPFELVPLGRTGLKVTRLSLGTGMRGGNRESNQTRMGREKFTRLIHGAYDRGVRHFDCADLYGSHPFVGPALKNMPRDKFAIVSKMWFRPGSLPEKERPDADAVVERFLKELQTEYVDVLLLHCVTSGKWPDELQRQMEILGKLKQKGMLRAHGVSVHSLEALELAATNPWVESVNTRINPYGIKMDGPPEKVVPVLKKMHANGKGVIGMKIVGEGELRNDPERRRKSIEYVLGLGCVDAMTVGFESLEELDDFTAMVRKVTVTAT